MLEGRDKKKISSLPVLSWPRLLCGCLGILLFFLIRHAAPFPSGYSLDAYTPQNEKVELP